MRRQIIFRRWLATPGATIDDLRRLYAIHCPTWGRHVDGHYVRLAD